MGPFQTRIRHSCHAAEEAGICQKKAKKREVFRERKDALTEVNDMIKVLIVLNDELEHKTNRNMELSPALQICLPLSYYTTGALQNQVGDTIPKKKYRLSSNTPCI